jgi:hypothetical protein
MCSTSNLECSCSRDDSLVFNSVLDCSETITDGILNLSDGMGIRSFDDKSDGFRRFDIFDIGILFFAKGLFVD